MRFGWTLGMIGATIAGLVGFALYDDYRAALRSGRDLPYPSLVTPWGLGGPLMRSEWQSGGRGWARFNGERTRVRMFYRFAGPSRPYTGEPDTLCLVWVHLGSVVAYRPGGRAWAASCTFYNLMETWPTAATAGWTNLPTHRVWQRN